MSSDPNFAVQDVQRRIYAGARLLLDSLSDEELAAAYALILKGEAEIINEACKPFVVRVLSC